MLMISLILCCAKAFSQDSTMFIYADSGMVLDELNVIQNTNHLDEFYEELFQLKNTNHGIVNIIHLGDSHIQADFLTKAIRFDLQRYFGNAGRGLIVPGRVAGTNEPFNIHSGSPQSWQAKRCVYPAEPLPIGVSGITIRNMHPGATLEIFMNELWQDYSFNSIGIFYLNDRSSFSIHVKDTVGNILGISRFHPDSTVNFVKLDLSIITERIVLEAVREDSIQNNATWFGFNLSNRRPGVLYHAIGVNGAKYVHYNAAPLFPEQTHSLDPRLIVLALGTNEALDYPYIDKKFLVDVDELVSKLRAHNPLAKFVIVTPSDAFIRKTRKNPGLLRIREQLLTYAVENGFAFYDWHQVMGGEGAAAKWKKANLMRSDGVHFTREGYELQGHAFFQAIMKGYNNYVSGRHQQAN